MTIDRMTFEERAQRICDLREEIGGMTEDAKAVRADIKRWEDEREAILRKRVEAAELDLEICRTERLLDQLIEAQQREMGA